MLTLYLTSLVVGGVFVGLSSVGGFGHHVDGHVDADGHVGADGHADADADADTEHALDSSHALALADGSHGLASRAHQAPKRWLPFLSFRFWTFGAAFFGLTGTLLTTLTSVGIPLVAMLSAGTGLGVGALSAWMIQWLRKPVGETSRGDDYNGQVGELMLPLREGGVSRIRLRVGGRERFLLASTPEPLALPAGTRVVVLGLDEVGKAQIAPEEALYRSEN
jgi:membrane protein implicated in regulation of membrane protease activity